MKLQASLMKCLTVSDRDTSFFEKNMKLLTTQGL